jgi:small subunit ribosomal protein S4e
MSKHISRISAPKKYPILKKIAYYVVKVRPGPHGKDNSIPLLLVLRDLLKVIKNAKEAKILLNSNKIMVDQTVRKDMKFPVGLMDVVSIPALNQNFRLVFDKDGKIVFTEIDEKESKLKLCKITNKRVIKNKKIQLNLHDGRNLIVNDAPYKAGDTLLLSLPNQEIKKHLVFEKETTVYIMDGRHIGELAKVSDFRPMTGSNPDRVILINEDGEKFETLKKYIFVVGKEHPEVKLYGK